MSQLNTITLESMNRDKDWDGIFQSLDSNFDKISKFLSSLGSDTKIQKFRAEEGQFIFTVDYTFNIGTNLVEVYVNGVRQFSDDFVEVSNTSIKLSEPLSEGDIVVIVYKYANTIDLTTQLSELTFKSPSGINYKLTIDDNGRLTTTKV